MFVIRREQMEVFRQIARARFEDEMVAHSRDFSPQLCEPIGEEQLRAVVRRAMEKAVSYGFTNRGPIRLFIEGVLLLGCAFDTDPQYPWAAKLLRASDDQMQRAEQLFIKIIDYQERISGPGALNTHQALGNLRALLGQAREPSSSHFATDMLQEMRRVFPRKAAYVGEEGLTALVHEGTAEARKQGVLANRGAALVVLLMFAFGHGCMQDPLHPWIAQAFTDKKPIKLAAQVKQLEKTMEVGIEQILVRAQERTMK